MEATLSGASFIERDTFQRNGAHTFWNPLERRKLRFFRPNLGVGLYLRILGIGEIIFADIVIWDQLRWRFLFLRIAVERGAATACSVRSVRVPGNGAHRSPPPADLTWIGTIRISAHCSHNVLGF